MNTKNWSDGNKSMLNDSQRRGLSTALCVFEEMLFEVAQVLQQKSYRGLLQEVEDDISLHIKDAMSEKILLIKDTVNHLADSLKLEKRIVNTSKQVTGKLFYCLELLENVKAKRLQRYGSIRDGLEDILDPQINLLIASVSSLVNLVRDKG